MNTPDLNRQEIVWKQLCLDKGWECRLCGAIPEVGKEFENNLCEDCKLSLRNYDPTAK